MNDLNPRNFVLNLDIISELDNDKIVEFILERYDSMLQMHREFLMGEKTEDLYLGYLNTLKDGGYIRYNHLSNNDEFKLKKEKINRKNKIDDILN